MGSSPTPVIAIQGKEGGYHASALVMSVGQRDGRHNSHFSERCVDGASRVKLSVGTLVGPTVRGLYGKLPGCLGYLVSLMHRRARANGKPQGGTIMPNCYRTRLRELKTVRINEKVTV